MITVTGNVSRVKCLTKVRVQYTCDRYGLFLWTKKCECTMCGVSPVPSCRTSFKNSSNYVSLYLKHLTKIISHFSLLYFYHVIWLQFFVAYWVILEFPATQVNVFTCNIHHYMGFDSLEF